MQFKTNRKSIERYVRERYVAKYDDVSFDEEWRNYLEIEPFGVSANIYNHTNKFTEKTQFIVRVATQYYLTKAFEAMKIDFNDPNVCEEEGSIGTPGRIAKMWVGSNLEDNRELLCGRWTKKPRTASFPNRNKSMAPVTKKVSLISMCSHHLVPFSTYFREDSYVLISYIPNKVLVGISKLQRSIDWISKRGWLQEDLTKAIYEEIRKIAQTESVYVELKNVIHSCEFFRGALCKDGAMSTKYYGGLFKDRKYRELIHED
jgi:GTP cyclohydrolase I